ncbi:hypothetical protein ACWGII_15020 [Streptomyces sp. NPDC054855]
MSEQAGGGVPRNAQGRLGIAGVGEPAAAAFVCVMGEAAGLAEAAGRAGPAGELLANVPVADPAETGCAEGSGPAHRAR